MFDQKANPGIWRSIAALLSACLILSLPIACNWQPRTLHSDVYQTGRVHRIGHGELGVHVLPGVGLDMGLGGKTEVHLGYDVAGNEISGLEGRLTRGFLQTSPVYNSISFGADYLEARDRGFKATRFHAGHTLSLIGDDKVFGLHLPLQLYYLSYD